MSLVIFQIISFLDAVDYTDSLVLHSLQGKFMHWYIYAYLHVHT